MERKQYEAKSDERRDQLIGFWTFPFVTAIFGVIYFLFQLPVKLFPSLEIFFQILPWIFNGFVVAAALYYRRHFAVGYLVSLAYWAAASLLYMPSCMVACSILQADPLGEDTFILCFTVGYLSHLT